MGIWDYVSSGSEAIFRGAVRSGEIVGGAAAPVLSGAWKNTCDLTGVASEAAVRTSQAVTERMPDREAWEKIGRLGLRIADHAIAGGTKPFTGGIPVYKFVKEEFSQNNKSQEQSVKEKKENMELVKLNARIESLEKQNMELQERMGSLEKEIMEIKQKHLNQKPEKRPNLMDSWLRAK